jgi:hypothetical protein
MSERVTDKQLAFQLEMAIKNTGLNLELSKYTPGDSYGSRYTLVEVDEHGGESELSHTCNRSTIYSILYSMNRVIERAELAPKNTKKEIVA